LAFLSSEQAVEDIADFINAQNTASGETNPKWVLFGGSYAGALVLWFRQKYPDLSLGAVSSSAPVKPTLDYYNFQANVDAAYAAYYSACYDAIKASTLFVRQYLQSIKGRALLTTSLKLLPAFDKVRVPTTTDLQFFNFGIATLFRLPVLFNRVNMPPFNTACGIADVCSIITDDSNGDGLGKVAAVASYMNYQLNNGWDSTPNNYTAIIEWLKTEDTDDLYKGELKLLFLKVAREFKILNFKIPASFRAWLWQDCTEFGFFPSTDWGRGLFGTSLPNNFFIDTCADIFGADLFNVDVLKAGIKTTASVYSPSSTYNGTNVVVAVGGADPWRSLCVNSTSDPSSLVYWADGMAHTADLMPPSSNDTYGVKFIRTMTARKVKSWVSGVSAASSKRVMKLIKDAPRDIEPALDESKPFVERWHKEKEFSEGSIVWDVKDHPQLKAKEVS